MATTKKKQSAKQKRILIASIVLAAAITVGATFAWFTSSDNVTNRLTASADYGVSITEDFTPPEDWVPGQEINKEVGAINTGNVSAFVKLTLTNAMTVTYEKNSTASYGNTTMPTDFTNYIKLARETALSPSTSVDSGDVTEVGAWGTDPSNEVAALQAGGMLVGVLQESSNSWSWLDKLDTVVGTQTIDTKGGDSSSATAEDVTLGKTNSSSFTPKAKGVYIFRRQITTSGTNDSTYTYSGYYWDGADYWKIANINAVAGSEPTYDRNDDRLTKAGTFTFNFVETVSEAKVPTFSWEYYDSTTGAYSDTAGSTGYNAIKAKTTGGDGEDIVLHINLNEGYDSTNYKGTNWTADKNFGTATANNTEAYFYLNKILEPGQTSQDLVKSVTLDSGTDQTAYTHFVYDLNIGLNSVQAVYDADGNIEAAKSKTAGDTLSSGASTTIGTVSDKTAPVTWTLSSST